MRLKLHAIVPALVFAATLQAQRLPRTVTPQHYDLSFAPNFAGDMFDGEETIEVTNELPSTSIKLHAMEITFKEVVDRDLRVMDLTAITFCKDNNLPICVFDVMAPGNIRRALGGDPIGTLVR